MLSISKLLVSRRKYDREMLAFMNELDRLHEEATENTKVCIEALKYLREHPPTRNDRRRAQHDAIVERITRHVYTQARSAAERKAFPNG